jgi:GNAT superfamily N-acetyltransferase
MGAISRTIVSSPDQLRPFDVGRDLPAVANLVEACFAETLDVDGRRYVQQMHAAARNPRYLRWAAAMADHVSMPLTGFVWEEHGQLVGNLSLIPFTYLGRRCYLIANVAVDPAYRRRGIARSLTAAALEHARSRGMVEAWLHVREENAAARNLYSSLGFRERARRTTWECGINQPGGVNQPGGLYQLGVANQPPVQAAGLDRDVKIEPRYAHFWPQQHAWLANLYPPELIWHLPFSLHALRPGLAGGLYRFLTGATVRQWAALRRGELLGVLSWQPHPGHADHLWLAAAPVNEETALAVLLPQARRRLARRLRLVMDFPAGRATPAFQEAGFHIQQTLVWMSVPL